MAHSIANVPSVNPRQPEIPDSESAGQTFVDPVFLEQSPELLPDEAPPTPEEIAAREAEEAAAKEAERKANGTPTKAELKKLIDELPDDEQSEEAPAADADEDKAKKAEEADKTAAKAGESDDDDDDEEAEEANAGRKPRRRSRARRERRALQRQIAEQGKEIERLKARAPAATAPAAPPDEGTPAPEATPPAAQAISQPKLEDYDNDADKWAEAMGEWTKSLVESGRKAAEEAEKRESEQREVIAKIEAFDERCEKMREKHDDFDEVVHDEELMISPVMAELIRDSEVGPQVAYHLGSNPDEAAEIAGQTPIQQTRAMTRLEAQFEAEQETSVEDDETNEAEEATGAAKAEPTETQRQQKKPPRSATKAPAPVPTVTGSSSGRRDPAKMSMSEYEEGRLSGKIR